MDAVAVRVGGLVITDYSMTVPLDHARPGGEQITLAATEVADPAGGDRPYLLYLTGGPGMEAPRVTRRDGDPPWLARALTEFRVLLLDQRGTGRSSPIGQPVGTPAEQAAYLAHFRADSIVRDAELLRGALGAPPWTVLGQSFGGFCTLSYLSLAPEGLCRALLSGGLPPLGRAVTDVYAATYATQGERNERYYARYPGDRGRVRALLDRLERGEVRLPGGDLLTGDRFRQLGLGLGMAAGAERLHHLLSLPADSPAFRYDAAGASPFARNPLYAVLHEACYADGVVTGWAAAQARPADWPAEFFTGEHIYPWMFRDIADLQPWAAAADLLAARDWNRLYDPDRLAANDVPAAAIVYAEDPYVDRRFSEQTAAATRGLRVWLTNEYEHDGLHADGARILDRLLALTG